MQTQVDGDLLLGMDIGGANLKAATASGKTWSTSFPMWQNHAALASTLRELVDESLVAANVRVGVTMTGELADCFANRRVGVHAILAEILRVWEPEQLLVYGVDGRWLNCHEAQQDPWAVAASNWHAFASWAAQEERLASAAGEEIRRQIVVDIGSTTTDITPIQNGLVATKSRTDRDRMTGGELVYTGVERTSAAMILSKVKIQDRATTHLIPTMAEHFATADDAYLLTGQSAASDGDDFQHADFQHAGTADGGPRTADAAHRRLARLIGEDEETVDRSVTVQIAEQLIDAQASQIAQAIMQVLKSPTEHQLAESNTEAGQCVHIIFGGHGWPLMQSSVNKLRSDFGVDATISSVADILDYSISRIGPAFSVATLLSQHLHHQKTSPFSG